MLRSGPPEPAVPQSLLRAVCTARALGLAPYSYSPSSGVYSASGRLRALSLAPALFVGLWGLAFLLAPLHPDTQPGLAQATAHIWKCIQAAQGLVLAWAAGRRLHPGLLPLLNSAAVRRGAAAVPLRYFAGVVLTPFSLSVLSVSVMMLTQDVFQRVPYGLFAVLFSFFVLLFQVAMTAYFAFLVHCVLARFADLNATLGKSFTRRLRGRHAEPLLNDAVAHVLGEHVKMSARLNTLCHCFGLPMALEMVLDFWTSLTFVYHLLEIEESVLNLHRAVWILGLSVRWVYVFVVSSEAAAKGNETLHIMNEFLAVCRDLTSEERTQLLLSCQVLHQQPVHVAVFGNYEISSKGFCKIVATFVTYEVILLQFDSSCVAPRSNSTAAAN